MMKNDVGWLRVGGGENGGGGGRLFLGRRGVITFELDREGSFGEMGALSWDGAEVRCSRTSDDAVSLDGVQVYGMVDSGR